MMSIHNNNCLSIYPTKQNTSNAVLFAEDAGLRVPFGFLKPDTTADIKVTFSAEPSRLALVRHSTTTWS